MPRRKIAFDIRGLRRLPVNVLNACVLLILPSIAYLTLPRVLARRIA